VVILAPNLASFNRDDDSSRTCHVQMAQAKPPAAIRLLHPLWV